MSGTQLQLTPPFSGVGGYRPRWSLMPQLTLDPNFTSSLPGWSVMGGTGQVYNLWPTGLGLLDYNLSNTLGAWSASLGANPSSSKIALPSFVKSLGINDWDDIYGLARKLGITTWADAPGFKRNIVTGQPAAAGKINPSGLVIPSSPDDAIAGFAIPAFSAGRRFGFSSSLDVHLYLYADKDALTRDEKYLFSGGGIGFETKTSDGTPLKLQLGAGRDPAGGAGGFINLQIGPDFIQMPQSP
jgi:hypothetical protein